MAVVTGTLGGTCYALPADRGCEVARLVHAALLQVSAESFSVSWLLLRLLLDEQVCVLPLYTCLASPSSNH